jgi:hypothetical protein
MAHPALSFPQDVYILNATDALAFTDGSYIYAVQNTTGSAINATCIGNLFTYQSDAYKPIATGQTIAIPSGATLYGRFTSVTGASAGLIAYVK